MTIQYRPMHPNDEDALLDFWLHVWEGSDRDYARRELYSDPLYLSHTFAAFTHDNVPIATTHYALKHIRDASGAPQLVGCVSHVATHPDARRQGHARRLMELTHDSIRRDGCAYALLFSSDEGKSLYSGMGYRHYAAPFWQGTLARTEVSSSDEYTVGFYNPETEPSGWQPLASIYDAANFTRPMSVVRDTDYWPLTIALRHPGLSLSDPHGDRAFLVSHHETGTPVAYALVNYSDPEYARKYHNMDQIFSINELGILPGHEHATSTLFTAITNASLPGKVEGRAYAPPEPHIESALHLLFGDTLTTQDDRNLMALPLSPSCDYPDLEATTVAPGATFWRTDEF